ncbi:FAD-dependent monooxygenase [Promicromonospora sp. NPDC057138]|uniref:FAD-dependent monooxygenase n=1 Tax=Promicromonospora sp. NPDC057138 TaxID=3346031 RepID=UPI0036320BA0
MAERMHPVLVVGAGPTGLTMANELVRHGVPVRVIDRAPTAATTSRALVVMPRTLEIFDDMGVVDAALAAGNRAPGLSLMFGKDKKGQDRKVYMDLADLLTGPRNHTAYSALRTLSQTDTERLLAEALAERGVDVERGVALTDLTTDGDTVTVSLRTEDGSTETAPYRWVVACDGAHSAVRKAIGMPFEGSTYPDEFIMADAELDWELPDGDLYTFPSPAGIFAAFAMPGEHRFRIFGNVATGPEGPREYSEPTHEEFQAMIDERVPYPAKVVQEYWVTRYRVHRRGVPRYRDGRVFLVGDAAHVHSPAGAQGMNTGIQDAYNLAWKLALVVRGIAEEPLLDSYHADRHPVGVRLLKTTDRMFGVIAGQSRLARMARGRVAPELASRLLTRDRVRRGLIGILAQLRLSYPDSPLNAESGSDWGDAPAPGDRAREAEVLIDGEPGRVHDVLRGTQHTVLLFTGLDEHARPAVELCRIAERIERAYPELVTARVVSAERSADRPLALGDPDRSAHRQYGVERASAFVVRPDGHVAYRGHPVDADALLADLAARLPGASAGDR